MANRRETKDGQQRHNRRNDGDRYQRDDFLVHIFVFVVCGALMLPNDPKLSHADGRAAPLAR